MTKPFMTRAKKLGGSVGIIIPREYADILQISEGDLLEVLVSKLGGQNDEATSNTNA